MTFPGFPLDTSKTNATPTTNDHPDHHNAVAAAANDLQGQVDALVLVDVSLQNQINALTALVNLLAPVASIVPMGRASTPAGWLAMGSSHVNADTAYPALWAAVPASWKSGTTLNLPDMADRVAMGGGTLGAVGGSNTHTLTTANLAAHDHTITHTHSIAHDHGSFSSGTQSANHVHDIGHNHGSFNTASGGGHDHDAKFLNVTNTGAGSAYSSLVTWTQVGGTTTSLNAISDGTHQHAIDVPLFSGSSGPNSVNHSHTVDVPNFTGNSGPSSATNTGSAGSGTAVTHTPANLRLNWYIKT